MLYGSMGCTQHSTAGPINAQNAAIGLSGILCLNAGGQEETHESCHAGLRVHRSLAVKKLVTMLRLT